jgi:hypothetical protein
MDAREQAKLDYNKAKELGLTNLDRWDQGIEHHYYKKKKSIFKKKNS